MTEKSHLQDMEQKHLLISALSVGVGVGLGLASGPAVSKLTGANAPLPGATADQIEHELSRLVQDGKESNVTFEDFPYYLRLYLKNSDFIFFKYYFRDTPL